MTAPRAITRPVVLVTGAGGQLGSELLRASWGSRVEVCGYGSAGLDITNQAAVDAVVDGLRPSVIVNAAAYTKVDRAEDEPLRAEAVNATAVKTLAQAANQVDAQLIHVSTDYVFDGTKPGWYVETDPINPLGVYGRTKAAGEEAAEQAERLVVLRTAWVYGALGPNFVTTMLRLAGERDEIGVVNDQVGCPSAAGDLARAIVEVVGRTDYGNRPPPRRLYHLAGPDAMTWFDFAQAVFRHSRSGFDGNCRPLTTAQYPTRARRPANSRLDSSLLEDHLGVALAPFDQALSAVVAELETGTGRQGNRTDSTRPAGSTGSQPGPAPGPSPRPLSGRDRVEPRRQP
ncbi:MAG: dTDP-4-dehydrorhamnose reductase [Acidimicrobiia bacterium]|nr:dTDP-4-dehydrorhamnose reductase [Acidimicrobiia bacterium]